MIFFNEEKDFLNNFTICRPNHKPFLEGGILAVSDFKNRSIYVYDCLFSFTMKRSTKQYWEKKTQNAEIHHFKNPKFICAKFFINFWYLIVNEIFAERIEQKGCFKFHKMLYFMRADIWLCVISPPLLHWMLAKMWYKLDMTCHLLSREKNLSR